MAEQIFDDGELIDESGFQKLARRVQDVFSRLPKVVYRNNKGSDTKKINSFSGKRLQIVAGAVEFDDRTKNERQFSITVNFAEPFSGKTPVVTAMVEGPVGYALSIGNISNQSFEMRIRKTSDSTEPDLQLRAIHYIAVGQP